MLVQRTYRETLHDQAVNKFTAYMIKVIVVGDGMSRKATYFQRFIKRDCCFLLRQVLEYYLIHYLRIFSLFNNDIYD